MRHQLSEMSLFMNRKIVPRDARIEGLKIVHPGTAYILEGKFLSMSYPEELTEIRRNSIGQEYTGLKYYETEAEARAALQKAEVPELK